MTGDKIRSAKWISGRIPRYVFGASPFWVIIQNSSTFLHPTTSLLYVLWELVMCAPDLSERHSWTELDSEKLAIQIESDMLPLNPVVESSNYAYEVRELMLMACAVLIINFSSITLNRLLTSSRLMQTASRWPQTTFVCLSSFDLLLSSSEQRNSLFSLRNSSMID